MNLKLFCAILPGPAVLSRNITGALGKALFLPTNTHVSTRRPDRLNHAAFLKGPMSWMQLGTSGLKSPVQLQCLYCRTGKTSLFKSAGKLWQRQMTFLGLKTHRPQCAGQWSLETGWWDALNHHTLSVLQCVIINCDKSLTWN